MEGAEQCDNGRIAGCPDCKVAKGYSCDSSSPSLCYKCGNSVKDPTEECDNGNKTGCIDCVKATNWNCYEDAKSFSSCYECGNGIIEFG